MTYERLTTVDKDGHIDITGIWDVDMRREDERKYHAAINRLAELEDKIESGVLVEKYFIAEEKFPDGKVMFNVAEYDTYSYVIVSQHNTKAEAEEKLRELRGEKD